MKKLILLFFVSMSCVFETSAQCDSLAIRIESWIENNSQTKIIDHFSSTRKPTSSEFYSKQAGQMWNPSFLEEFVYDLNDSLISDLQYNWVSASWLLTNRFDFTYDTNGNHLTEITTNIINGNPIIQRADSFIYDFQNRMITHFNFYNGNLSKVSYFYNLLNQDTLQLNEARNTVGVWNYVSKKDRYFNSNGFVAEEYIFQYTPTFWDSLNVNFYYYGSDALVDTIIQQSYLFPYSETMFIYQYGSMNLIIDQLTLEWNGSQWQYRIHNVNLVDTFGNTTYRTEFIAVYNPDSTYYFVQQGYIISIYDSLGNLLSYSGEGSPGGPFDGSITYANGVPVRAQTFSETMGGTTKTTFTDYFYADLYGDTIICNNSLTTLSVDSCPGNSYLWSNGATTSSIIVGAGTYSASIIYANGYTTRTPEITVGGLELILSIVSTNCIGCNDGIIEADVTAGVGPVVYTINPPAGTQNGNLFANLPSGIYQVCVTDSLGCMACKIDIILEDPSDVNEINKNSVFIFPNPTHSSITVHTLNLPHPEYYFVENILGEIIKSGKLQNEFSEINLQELSSGFYFLRFNGSERKAIRFMKQ